MKTTKHSILGQVFAFALLYALKFVINVYTEVIMNTGLYKVARAIALSSLIGECEHTTYTMSRRVGLSDTTCRKHLRKLAYMGFLSMVYKEHRPNVVKQVFTFNRANMRVLCEYFNLDIPIQLELPL